MGYQPQSSMHWQLRDALAFENKQGLTTLKEKSHHPGSSKYQLHPVLPGDWGQENHWPRWNEQQKLPLTSVGPGLTVCFVCLVSMSYSKYLVSGMFYVYSLDGEGSKHTLSEFPVHHTPLLLIEHWRNWAGNQSVTAVTSDAERFISLHCLAGYPP